MCRYLAKPSASRRFATGKGKPSIHNPSKTQRRSPPSFSPWHLLAFRCFISCQNKKWVAGTTLSGRPFRGGKKKTLQRTARSSAQPSSGCRAGALVGGRRALGPPARPRRPTFTGLWRTSGNNPFWVLVSPPKGTGFWWTPHKLKRKGENKTCPPLRCCEPKDEAKCLVVHRLSRNGLGAPRPFCMDPGGDP